MVTFAGRGLHFDFTANGIEIAGLHHIARRGAPHQLPQAIRIIINQPLVRVIQPGLTTIVIVIDDDGAAINVAGLNEFTQGTVLIKGFLVIGIGADDHLAKTIEGFTGGLRYVGATDCLPSGTDISTVDTGTDLGTGIADGFYRAVGRQLLVLSSQVIIKQRGSINGITGGKVRFALLSQTTIGIKYLAYLRPFSAQSLGSFGDFTTGNIKINNTVRCLW